MRESDETESEHSVASLVEAATQADLSQPLAPLRRRAPREETRMTVDPRSNSPVRMGMEIANRFYRYDLAPTNEPGRVPYFINRLCTLMGHLIWWFVLLLLLFDITIFLVHLCTSESSATTSSFFR